MKMHEFLIKILTIIILSVIVSGCVVVVNDPPPVYNPPGSIIIGPPNYIYHPPIDRGERDWDRPGRGFHRDRDISLIKENSVKKISTKEYGKLPSPFTISYSMPYYPIYPIISPQYPQKPAEMTVTIVCMVQGQRIYHFNVPLTEAAEFIQINQATGVQCNVY